jgi:WD40 repeat protein
LFLTCSADGCVRLFDRRQHYQSCEEHAVAQDVESADRNAFVMPQAYGGGRRAGRGQTVEDLGSLQVAYTMGEAVYSVDWHPAREELFLAAAGDGNARLFDLRMIRRHAPSSHVNVYRSIDIDARTECV